MKKRFAILLPALAAILLLPCCSKAPELEGGDWGSMDGIVLQLRPGGVEVKSTPNADPTRPGNWDGAFNENSLGTEVEVFFFRADATHDTPSVYHEGFPVNSNGFVQIPISQDKLYAIFGGEYMNAEAKVLVVANYNGTTPISDNPYSVNQLRALELAVADWTAFPQTSFVMMSTNADGSSPLCPIKITRPNTSSPASATVDMKRVAAKVSFRITVADEIKVVNVTRDAAGEVISRSLETWTPQKDAITAYMQYSVKTATLGGDPQSPPAVVPLATVPADHPTLMAYTARNFRQTTDVIARTRTPILSLDETQDPPVPVYGTPVTSDFPVYEVKMTVEGLSTAGPFYTYPVSWEPGAAGEPFIKLIIPWKSGNTVKYYYYKVPFKASPLESNRWYEMTLDVQILGGEDQQPVPLEASYQVVGWERGTQVDVAASVGSPRYLSVPITEFVMYNKDELTIPITSSHDVRIVGYTVKTGATSQTNNAVGRAFTSNDKDDDGSWIGTNPKIYNPFTNTLATVPASNPPTVVSVKATRPNYNYYTSGLPYPVTLDASSWFPTAEITRDQVVLVHALNNDMSSKDSNNKANYDVAPYYIRIRIQHADDASYYKDVMIEQRPAIVIEPQLNSDGTNDANHGYVRIDNTNSTTTDSWRRNSSLSGGNNANPNMYIITTSVLSSGSSMIGDPRFNSAYSDNNLVSGWTSSQAAFVDGTANQRLSHYYPTVSDDSKKDVIAPSFRVASSYGKSQAMSYSDAQRRCAAYQEDGYPAGRWRIPTMAEVLYMTQLSQDGMIPELFTFTANVNRDPSYWCASGVIDGVLGVPTYYEGLNPPQADGSSSYSGKRHVRCVYDEWFWEDTTYERVAISNFRWGDQAREDVKKKTQ